MGEAKRRQQQARVYSAFFDQAQKAVDLHLVTGDEIQGIALAALDGDRKALVAGRAILGIFERLGDRAQPPMLCMACDNKIKPGETHGPLVVQFPHGAAGADLKAVMGSVCCAACGELERPELKRRIVAMIDRIYWPGVHEMKKEHVSAKSGRA